MAGAITFQEFVAQSWKATCYDRCKPSTRKRMDTALRTQLLPAFGPLRLNRIESQAVHRWFDAYSHIAPASANRTLDVLRQILNYAVACGHVKTNPTRGVKRNPRPQRTRFLSQAELGRLHDALDAHRGRRSGQQQTEIIRLLLFTGCRKSEIVGLRWQEVGEDALYLSDSKTGPRTVFLNREARGILARQPRMGSPYVFPSPDDVSKSRPLELSLWRKVRRQAGINDARVHDLRHTFASHAVMQGVPLPVVARLLGHSHTRMTLRYAHVCDRETEAAAERIGIGIAEALSLPVNGGPERDGELRAHPTQVDRKRARAVLRSARRPAPCYIAADELLKQSPPGSPARCEVHPGEDIRVAMDLHGWCITETATKLECARQTLSRLLNGHCGISLVMALALERIGWKSAAYWMGRQAHYDLSKERNRRKIAV